MTAKMVLRPYSIFEPQGECSPLIVDSPHSGRLYPSDFLFDCPLSLLRQAEDAFMDEIVSGATKAGATLITAEFPRSMIDLNRAETDLDPAVIAGPWPDPLSPTSVTLMGFGLVRRICKSGISLYRLPLTPLEIKRRIEKYYRPYHAILAEKILQCMSLMGECYFIDAHSMPDRTENGVARPDFILGDRDGTSCDPSFTEMVRNILEQMDYTVALNDPYKGREIVLRHGLQGGGAHALQIEVNRKLYMNELECTKHAGFETLQANMTDLFQYLAHFVKSVTVERLVAE